MKLLIVDDHPVTRAGIKAVLENDGQFQIIGEAKDGLDAIHQVDKLKPDIVIMDISMPNLSGIKATEEILREHPEIKVVALSIHTGENFVKEMLKAGAVAYLMKDEAPEELKRALVKVMKGDIYLSPEVTRNALKKEDKEDVTSSYNILKTKLLRPPVMHDYLVRKRITDELEQNVYKPFSVTSAGAGYGKSVAISQWLDQTQRLHVWISLDKEHNDFRIFLFYLVEAIENITPGSMQETAKVISGAEMPSFKDISFILFNDLFNLEDELIIVLDDYHKIVENKIHDLLSDWLKFPPPNVHLSIITRRDPPLKIRSLQLHGRMTEIRMETLSFTDKEIVLLFKQLLDIDLSKKAVQALYNKTEGWIIALRLTSMVIRQTDDVDRVIAKIEGGMNTISDYLVSEVLSQQPEHIRFQLMGSSILNRFCEELIEELSINPGDDSQHAIKSDEFIMWLRDSNMFLIDLDIENKWFRYHHLFQKLLQEQLKKTLSKNEIIRFQLKASQWFEKHGFLEEAIYHATNAEDFDRAAQIVKKHRISLLNNFKWLLLEKLLSHLPESIIDESIELLLAKAYMVFNRTDMAGLSEQIVKMEKLLETGLLRRIYILPGSYFPAFS